MYNFELCYIPVQVKILIINGPNLNLLGKREPTIYGQTTFEKYLTELRNVFSTLQIDYFQSNIEGELIDKLHESNSNDVVGVVLNAGGYSHTSVAIADAVAAIQTPVISVHISNIYTREEERHKELLSKSALGGIFGLGMRGYELAIRSLSNL